MRTYIHSIDFIVHNRTENFTNSTNTKLNKMLIKIKHQIYYTDIHRAIRMKRRNTA